MNMEQWARERRKVLVDKQSKRSVMSEEPPLSDAGIFAITGPTSAGKTTILDAITLALYGSAARDDRALPSEIMSRHTGDCFAEVQFECQGHKTIGIISHSELLQERISCQIQVERSQGGISTLRIVQH